MERVSIQLLINPIFQFYGTWYESSWKDHVVFSEQAGREDYSHDYRAKDKNNHTIEVLIQYVDEFCNEL